MLHDTRYTQKPRHFFPAAVVLAWRYFRLLKPLPLAAPTHVLGTYYLKLEWDHFCGMQRTGLCCFPGEKGVFFRPRSFLCCERVGLFSDVVVCRRCLIKGRYLMGAHRVCPALWFRKHHRCAPLCWRRRSSGTLRLFGRMVRVCMCGWCIAFPIFLRLYMARASEY